MPQHMIYARMHMVRRWCLPAMALAWLILWTAVPARAGPPHQFEPSDAAALRPVTQAGYFKVSVPADWIRYRSSMELSDVEHGLFQVVMLGPRSSEGPRTEITVSYFAPDNHRYKAVDKYLRLHAHPVMAISGETYSEVREEQFGDRKALRFELLTFEFLPPYSVDPKKIPVHESYVVFPASAGFYVLSCHAAMDRKELVLGLFELVLASFQPLVE